MKSIGMLRDWVFRCALVSNYNNDLLQLLVITGYDNRTVVSGAALLASLFPPNKDQCWSSDLNWQPIPVHTDRIIDEVLLKCMIVGSPKFPVSKIHARKPFIRNLFRQHLGQCLMTAQ